MFVLVPRYTVGCCRDTVYLWMSVCVYVPACCACLTSFVSNVCLVRRRGDVVLVEPTADQPGQMLSSAATSDVQVMRTCVAAHSQFNAMESLVKLSALSARGGSDARLLLHLKEEKVRTPRRCGSRWSDVLTGLAKTEL